MRRIVHTLVPLAVRRSVGGRVAWLRGLHRDSASVRQTARHAPAALVRSRLARGRRPTVCAVFAGRDDDFVADNVERIRAVVEWNSRVLCDEVIFVEWNPLPDRPLLSPKLARDYPNLTAYVVPPEVHARVSTNARMPVLEYLAKNVAIRRARADYVCATNSDILWDANVGRLRSYLDPRVVFRTRRVELRWDGSPPSREYLRDPANRVEYRYGWRQMLGYGCGDFTMAHRELWHRAGGYDESLAGSRIHCDSRGLLQLIALGGRPVHMGLHYHLFHGTSSVSSGNVSHGEPFKYWEGIPYANPAGWGLEACRDERVADRVWMLRDAVGVGGDVALAGRATVER